MHSEDAGFNRGFHSNARAPTNLLLETAASIFLGFWGSTGNRARTEEQARPPLGGGGWMQCRRRGQPTVARTLLASEGQLEGQLNQARIVHRGVHGAESRRVDIA